MLDEDAKDRLLRWGNAQGARLNEPAAGEVWFVENEAMDIDHTGTIEHPGAVSAVSGGMASVFPGTSDVQRHGANAIQVHEYEVDTEGTGVGLTKTTYFFAGLVQVAATHPDPFTRYIGRANPQILTRLRFLLKSTFKRPERGTIA